MNTSKTTNQRAASASNAQTQASGTASNVKTQQVQSHNASAAGGDSLPVRRVNKLTTHLLQTYRYINDVYYKKKRERQQAREAEAEAAQKGSDSTRARSAGEFEFVQGARIGPEKRYEVLSRLGKGSFGQVVSARDVVKDEKVAIKIIRNKEAFRRQAKTEIEILQLLNSFDANNQWCLIRFLDTFDHDGHTCIVFEHLSCNMYELLKRTNFTGVTLHLVRKFARQILRTLAFLSLPDIDIIHCDLKPENILFRLPNRSAIKVIDFGSSCKRNKQMYVYIQSRFYRSPEVILGLPYTQAIDMWSLGCILVEMHTGVPLFSGRDEHDQITRFVAMKGLPPQWMLEKGKKTAQFFDIITPSVPNFDVTHQTISHDGQHPLDKIQAHYFNKQEDSDVESDDVYAKWNVSMLDICRNSSILRESLPESPRNQPHQWQLYQPWNQPSQSQQSQSQQQQEQLQSEQPQQQQQMSSSSLSSLGDREMPSSQQSLPLGTQVYSNFTTTEMNEDTIEDSMVSNRPSSACQDDSMNPTRLCTQTPAGTEMSHINQPGYTSTNGSETVSMQQTEGNLSIYDQRHDRDTGLWHQNVESTDPTGLPHQAESHHPTGSPHPAGSSHPTGSHQNVYTMSSSTRAENSGDINVLLDASTVPKPNVSKETLRIHRHLLRMQMYRGGERQPVAPVYYRLKPRTKRYPREPKIHRKLSSVLNIFNGGPGAHNNREKNVAAMNDAKHQEWHYTMFMDLLEKMLEYDPQRRITPLEALSHPFLREENPPEDYIVPNEFHSSHTKQQQQQGHAKQQQQQQGQEQTHGTLKDTVKPTGVGGGVGGTGAGDPEGHASSSTTIKNHRGSTDTHHVKTTTATATTTTRPTANSTRTKTQTTTTSTNDAVPKNGASMTSNNLASTTTTSTQKYTGPSTRTSRPNLTMEMNVHSSSSHTDTQQTMTIGTRNEDNSVQISSTKSTMQQHPISKMTPLERKKVYKKIYALRQRLLDGLEFSSTR